MQNGRGSYPTTAVQRVPETPFVSKEDNYLSAPLFFTQLSAGNQYLPSPIQCRTPPCLALMLDTSVRRPSSILSGRLSRILYWTSICPIIFHTTIELMPTRKCSTLTSLDHAKYVEERNFYFCGLFGTNSLSGIWLLHVYTTLPYLALSL